MLCGMVCGWSNAAVEGRLSRCPGALLVIPERHFGMILATAAETRRLLSLVKEPLRS